MTGIDLTYETGLRALAEYIKEGDPSFAAFTLHANSLRANISKARLFGDNPTASSERGQLIYELNAIALQRIGMPFTDLNRGLRPTTEVQGEPQLPPSQPAPPSQVPAGQLLNAEIDKLEEILARTAAGQPNPQQYLRYLLDRAELTPSFRNEITGQYVGNLNTDARRILTWALSKQGPNPQDKRATTLGSVLTPLLRDVALDDAGYVATIIVARALYRDRSLRENLAQRYQVPLALPPAAAVDSGPAFDWYGPDDELTLQSFFTQPPDFQDVGFLIEAVARARSVCKIELPDIGRTGTGFLVADRLLLTNYHVLRLDPAEDLLQNARRLRLRFGHFTLENNQAAEGRVFTLDAGQPVLASSPTDTLDYALLLVADSIMGEAGAGLRPVTLTQDEPAPMSALHILQHPGDAAMKLAVGANGVTSVRDGKLVQYVTRAAGGSSGAPCFNHKWEVIALHHAERSRGFGAIREGVLMRAIYAEIKGILDNYL